MNANQIINMVVRMVVRRLIRGGVNAGIDAVGNRMNKGKKSAQTKPAPETGDTVKRARQTIKMARRLR